MRVAIVHDWLTGMRGGERVLEALLEMFANADIFTLVHVPGSVSATIESRTIHTSFIGSLPVLASRFRHMLPIFPVAIERFDLRAYDLVISSSHCVAKGAIAPPAVPHLCYCHTPMRYVWDQYASYFGRGRASLPVRVGMRMAAPRLRAWDVATATRAHALVANSFHVRDRIRRHWSRDAAVVYPPVDVDRFQPAAVREDFYLIVSALVPYKRVDIAVQAFARAGRRLIVVGEGPEYARLSRLNGRSAEFTGHLDDAEVAALMGRCRGFVLPGEEDFGIAAVEAQAAGAPVIAYARGGARETVIGLDANGNSGAGATGVFFDEPTPASLAAALEQFEAVTFDEAALRANASRFAPGRFRGGMRAQLDALLQG